jgi:hypothetical protein
VGVVRETPAAGKKMTAGDPPQHPPTHQISSGKVKTQKKATLSDTLASSYVLYSYRIVYHTSHKPNVFEVVC